MSLYEDVISVLLTAILLLVTPHIRSSLLEGGTKDGNLQCKLFRTSIVFTDLCGQTPATFIFLSVSVLLLCTIATVLVIVQLNFFHEVYI